jgi:hypothetical protein
VWWQTHASSPTTDPTNSAEELSQFRYRALGSSELCATRSALLGENVVEPLEQFIFRRLLCRDELSALSSQTRCFRLGVMFLDQQRGALLDLLQRPRWPVSVW